MSPSLLTCMMAVWPSIVSHTRETHRVTPPLVAAVIMQESYCNTRAVSDSNARGLMQVVPQWVKWDPALALHCGGTDLHDPDINICFGVHILARYARQCREDWRCALARYSGGHPGYFSQVRQRLRRWRAMTPQPV